MNVVWLIILGAIWGSSYLFIKVAVVELPPLTLVAVRLLLSAVVLWLLVLVARRRVPRDRRVWLSFAAMGVLNGALPYSLISWSEVTISSGLAALLQATMPLFTVLLAHFVLRDERLTPSKVAGIVLGFVGVGVLMLPDLKQGAHGSVVAELAMIGSSVSYAGAALVARGLLHEQPPLVATAGQLVSGAAIMVPLSLVFDGLPRAVPSAPALGSLLGLTLLGTVVAYVIYYALIQRTSATFTSMVTYLIPIFGLVLGRLVLNEPLHAALFAGLGLILAGVLLVRR